MDLNPGSGAAVAESPTAPDFSTYARDANARDLGRPSTTEPGEPSASPADSPAAPAAATAAKPDAGSDPAAPGTPKDGAPTGSTKNAKTRTAELDEEIRGIQERLKIRRQLREEEAALSRGTSAAHAQPGSAPAADKAPTAAEWERFTRLPDAPKVEQFAEYEQFVAAQAAFVAGKVFEDRSARAQRDSESRARVESVQTTIRAFNERYQAAIAADPTLESKIDPRVLEVTPAFALAPNEPVGPHNLLAQAIVESEAAPALLAHYSTDEGRAEWGRIVKAGTPTAMIREFLDLLHTARAGSGAGASAPAVSVTSAPEPPTVLGKKPAAPADRVGAAVAKGDVRAYMAAATAADLARRK